MKQQENESNGNGIVLDFSLFLSYYYKVSIKGAYEYEEFYYNFIFITFSCFDF